LPAIDDLSALLSSIPEAELLNIVLFNIVTKVAPGPGPAIPACIPIVL